jgi:hypothetical protein
MEAQTVKLLFTLIATVVLFDSKIVCGDDSQRGDTERAYVIECRIVGRDPNGQELVITAPKISVAENQPASIRDECQIPRPGNTDEVELLEEGTAIDVQVIRDKDGQRFLDAKLTLTGQPAAAPPRNVAVRLLTRFVPAWLWEPAPDEQVGIRLISAGVRVVEPLELNKKIEVPFGRNEPQRLEILVSEMESQDGVAARPEPCLMLGGVTPRIIITGEEEEKLGIGPQP